MFVAPDGASIAVNASSIASEITNSTGLQSESWIYDRALARVTQHDSGDAFPSWDGRRLPTTGSCRARHRGDHRRARCRHRPRRSDCDGFIGLAAFAGNLAGMAATPFSRPTAVIGDDIDGLADLYVLDRDATATAWPTTWETLFGLNPSAGVDALSIPMATAPPISRSSSAAATRRASTALPRRRHQQRLLPDPGRDRQPGHYRGDRGDAVPGENGRTWSGAFQVPARQSRSLAARGPLRVLVLHDHQSTSRSSPTA